MNLADATILLLISVSALIGLWRGFVREAFSLVTWVAALIVATLFSPGMQQLLQGHIDSPSVRAVSAFVILFIITLIIGALVNRLLVELVRITGLSGTDRALGMVFGLIRGGVIVVVLVALAFQLLQPVQQYQWWSTSLFIPTFLGAREWLGAFFGQLVAVLVGVAGQG